MEIWYQFGHVFGQEQREYWASYKWENKLQLIHIM